MSHIPEVNPADAPVAVVTGPVSRAASDADAARRVGGVVPWAPIGLVMSLTFALLQLMNEVGSLIVVPLYGGMIKDLSLTPASVSWALLATTIASAATLGLIARLADNFGHKRLLVITISLVAIGFALSALAPDFTVLVIGRVLVGITAAPALCLAILNNRLSLSDQKRGIGIITGGLAIAVFAGFVVGGIMVQIGASWRAAFWVATVLTLISMVGLIWTPESDATLRKRSNLDAPGVILLGVGLTAICIGLSEAGTLGWKSGVVLALVIGGVVVGALWVLWELRSNDPIVDPRLIGSRRLLPAYGTFVVIGFTALFLYQLVTLYAETPKSSGGYGFGLSVLLAGLVLLPVTVGGLITSRTTPVLLATYGPRFPLILGASVFSLSFLWLWIFHTEIWQYEVGIMLFGMSVTTTITTSFAVMTAEAPPERAAGVSSVYLVVSTVISSIGVAIYAALVGSGTVTVKGATYVTPATYDTAYLIMFIVSLLGIVFALTLSKDSKANPEGAHH